MFLLTEKNWGSKDQIKPVLSVLEVRERSAPNEKPIMWIYLERIEKYERDEVTKEIYEASIRISYQLIFDRRERESDNRTGYFCGSYSNHFNTVSITSQSALGSGAVFLDLPKGQRIGTYLMSEIVAWVKRFPDAEVNEVEIIASQADLENKVRRNRLYEQIGLRFNYADDSQKSGKSLPMLSRDLIVKETWKENISELNPIAFSTRQCEQLMDLEFELLSITNAMREVTADLNYAYGSPLKWFIKALWYKHKDRIIVSAIFPIFGVLAWIKWG